MDRRNEEIEGKYLEGHHYDYKDYMSYYLKKLKR